MKNLKTLLNQLFADKQLVKVASISIVGVVLLIIIFITAQMINTQHALIPADRQAYFPPDVDYPEVVSADEQALVSDDVTAMLSSKYGKTANFEVLKIEKGVFKIGDVSEPQKYFRVDVRLDSPDIKTDFTVNYLKRTDDLWDKLQETYQPNTLAEFKEINDDVSAVSYSLSHYSGTPGGLTTDYASLDTVLGHIPNQQDINALVKSIDITLDGQDSGDYKEVIGANKPELKELYAYIVQNYPLIPQGVGSTMVEVDFGNGVIVRILPLAKRILVEENQRPVDDVDYKWSELVTAE